MDTSAPATPNAVASPRTRAKAIVAISAGAALLLGGGGTLAYWSTQQVIATGTINSGDLNLSAGTGAWTLQGVAQTVPTPVTDITAVKLVPGDVLTLTQPVSVTLVGDTIEAALTVDEGTIPAGLTATVSTTGATADALTAADSGKTLTVTVTLTFDSSTSGRDLVNSPFDLAPVTLTLTQLSS